MRGDRNAKRGVNGSKCADMNAERSGKSADSKGGSAEMLKGTKKTSLLYLMSKDIVYFAISEIFFSNAA